MKEILILDNKNSAHANGDPNLFTYESDHSTPIDKTGLEE